MANISGLFVFRSLDKLQQMQTEWDACLTSIATGQQSYSIAGRTFTRANLEEVKMIIAEIDYAIAYRTGGVVRTVYADMSD